MSGDDVARRRGARGIREAIMRSAVTAIRRILLLRCEEADRLLSDSLDRRLSWSQRVALEAHVAICRSCRRARQQVHTLRRAMRGYLERVDAAGTSMTEGLSPDARERIRRALKDGG